MTIKEYKEECYKEISKIVLDDGLDLIKLVEIMERIAENETE